MSTKTAANTTDDIASGSPARTTRRTSELTGIVIRATPMAISSAPAQIARTTRRDGRKDHVMNSAP